MDMMGISYPAINGDYFPYHAWSGPDFDPEVQDVAITTAPRLCSQGCLKRGSSYRRVI